MEVFGTGSLTLNLRATRSESTSVLPQVCISNEN